MRLTQFGHQVPRRNSATRGPCCTKYFNDTACGMFAASNMNSGARSPMCSVEFSLAIDGTVKHPRKRDNNGRNRGIKKGSVRLESDSEGVRTGRRAKGRAHE